MSAATTTAADRDSPGRETRFKCEDPVAAVRRPDRIVRSYGNRTRRDGRTPAVRPNFTALCGDPGGRLAPRRLSPVPPRTRYARSPDGVSIAYQVIGSGERDVVFVPQTFAAVEALWEHPSVARFFERLGAIGRVILFD